MISHAPAGYVCPFCRNRRGEGGRGRPERWGPVGDAEPVRSASTDEVDWMFADRKVATSLRRFGDGPAS